MAVTLNLIAIFIITFVVANFVISTTVSLLGEKFLHIQVKPRKILLWLMILMPWLIGLATALYLLDIYLSSSVFYTESYTHWHHMDQFDWYSWHGATLLIALLYAVNVIGQKIKQLYQHKQQVNALTALATATEKNLIQIDTPQAGAFTTGFIDKKCFVTTGLINQTTTEEYDVVISHEQAHAKANDPFKKWLFSLLAEFFIPPIAERLKLHMVLAMEQDADNAVIKLGKDKLFVASTLIKIAKLNAQDPLVKDSELIVNFGADVLEQRIFFLLDKLKLQPINKYLTSALVLLLVLICMTSLDGIHHVIETLFSHE